MAAKYLIRFDDICPTMNWRVWQPIETALFDLGIQPIVSVVPDNQDPALCIERPQSDFWARVRHWQTRGWSVGLHGYQHTLRRCSTDLLRIATDGEFAGLTESEQAIRIKAGVSIF